MRSRPNWHESKPRWPLPERPRIGHGVPTTTGPWEAVVADLCDKSENRRAGRYHSRPAGRPARFGVFGRAPVTDACFRPLYSGTNQIRPDHERLLVVKTGRSPVGLHV
jgi:hypothetical protein